MESLRHATVARFRLLVALLAAIGVMARLLAPMPATAALHTQVFVQLEALGAALCHTGSGPGTPNPADPTDCNHCPLCIVDGAATPGPPAAGLALPSPVSVRVSPLLDTAACPRVPPERAHPPRAPPLV